MAPSSTRRVRDDDGSDEPTPKKKRRADEDKGRKPKPKKKTGGPLTLILMIGGGVSLLGCCTCGAGVGAYFLFFSNPVVGTWEAQEKFGPVVGAKAVFNFDRNNTGKCTVTIQNIGLKTESVVQHFSYTYKSGKPNVLEITVTRIDTQNVLGAAMRDQIGRPQRLEVEFRDNTMLVRIPGAVGQSVWRRVG